MAATLGIREWAPLWAVPVVPVAPGAAPGRAVQEYFPGDITHFAVRWYRSVRAVLLVPTSVSESEASLPVPLLALVALGRRRRGDRVYQFPTSRGYDCYRFSGGRLSAIWTGANREPGAQEIPLPGSPGKLRRLRPRRPASGGRVRRFSGTNAATVFLLILALALRITGSGAAEAPSPSADGRQQRDRSVATVVDLTVTADALEEIVAAIPGVRLTSLRVEPQGAVVRLWSPLAADRALPLLEKYLSAGQRRRWSLQGSEITVEVAYE